MTAIQAMILGLIQGITEFLPVSSSGHLEIGKHLFDLNMSGGESLTFDVVVHAGTALSTIVVFRKDIGRLIAGLLEFKWNDETKFTSYIIVSMIPAAFIGLAFEDQIASLFEGQLLLVGAMLVLTGILLFLADRSKETTKSVFALDAFVVGLAQAIAILPGVSRSGATISTSVLLGIDRSKAAQFSFLMVLPIILGKTLLDTKDIIAGQAAGADVEITSLMLGLLAAFVSGVFACKWMIALVRRAKLKYFSYYCFGIAAIVLLSQFFGF
ncbi:MAG: undecaprenyl-diphosphate phosphatase [Schleiferiaceae bacterium]|nr:undecaprenyl-diphosphate phosphatase [Schleiferiaceae bacterium]